jgi:phytanoyl-CoA hydroxylase
MNQQPLYSYSLKEHEDLAKEIGATMYRYDLTEEYHIASIHEVTEQDVKRFWERGYLVIDNTYSEDEVHNALKAIMDIIQGRMAGPRIQFVKPQNQLHSDLDRELAVRKLDAFVGHEPRLHHLAYHSDVLRLIETLLGETPKLVQDQALLKPPAGGAEKPWHQDMAYGNLTYEKPVIGVWAALDPATLDNGCMHVIPRSHMNGAIPHYAVRDWQICDANVPVEKDVAIPMDPGSILIFHGMLMHGTPPNFSRLRRRSVQFHYAPQSAEKMSPREYKRWFTNELTRTEC